MPDWVFSSEIDKCGPRVDWPYGDGETAHLDDFTRYVLSASESLITACSPASVAIKHGGKPGIESSVDPCQSGQKPALLSVPLPSHFRIGAAPLQA
jgi:hypothetical protein